VERHRTVPKAWWVCLLFIAAGCGSSRVPGGGSPDGGGLPVAASIEVTPSALLLTGAGQERTLRARVLDAAGNELNLPVAWSSSTPAEVSVSAGAVRSVADLGSSVVRAVVGNVRSAPVLVTVAEPQPGALLVTDAQVVSVGPPIVEGPDAPDLGWDREVTLRLPTDPAVGTVVLASESAAVAGKVVSIRRSGDTVVVRLARAALPDVLLRYALHLDLQAGDLRLSPPPVQSLPGVSRQALQVEGEGHLGPLECSFSLGAGVGRTFTNGLEVQNSLGLKLDTLRTAPEGERSVEFRLSGALALVGRVGIRLDADVDASGECKAETTIVLPVTGFYSGIVTVGVPVGLGISIDVGLDVVALEANLENVQVGVALDLGFACTASGGCSNTVNKVDRLLDFTPVVNSGAQEGMKVSGDIFPYFLTGAKLVAGLGLFEFGLVDIKVGPKQSFDLAFTKRQADEAGYSSRYQLDRVAEFSPASDLKKLVVRCLGEEAAGQLLHSVPFTFGTTRSPHGTMSVDRSRISASEKATFTVHLSDLNYGPLGYNVKSVIIKRKLKDGPGYEDMQTLGAAQNLDTFTWDWHPTVDDAGENQFYAFVKTRLDVVELEIGDDSLTKVEVVPICGPLPPGAITGAELLRAASSTGCTINGTMQGSISGQTSTFFVDTRITAQNVLLQEDPEASLPGQQVVFRATGDWTLSHQGRVNDCTVSSPGATGALDGSPETGALTLDLSGGAPYAYTAVISTPQFMLHTILDCPGDPPTHTEQDEPTALTVMSTLFSETAFTVSDAGVLDGTNTIGQGVTQHYQWHLTLQPPSSAGLAVPPR